MIAAFFRPPAKRAPAEDASRPASPPPRTSDAWTLVPVHRADGIAASPPSLSDLDDAFDETSAYTPAPAPTPSTSSPSTVRSTPGLPHFWTLGSPSASDLLDASRNLVMPGSLHNSYDYDAPHVPRPETPPALEALPAPAASRFSLRAVALPVGSAIAASCATVAYHALGSVVTASYDAVPLAVVPLGVSFLASQYPMASLVGAAAGSLWGLHHLSRPAVAMSNVRTSRTSMCISALTTSVWLFTMGPAAIVDTAGSVMLDLAQPAAQTYLLGALGLLYHYDWTQHLSGGGKSASTSQPLIMHPDDAAALLGLAQDAGAEKTEQP